VVFVPGAEPGQRVKVQIEKVGGTYAVGRVVT
jgi:predicted RNA-binding protein with TRAM domain